MMDWIRDGRMEGCLWRNSGERVWRAAPVLADAGTVGRWFIPAYCSMPDNWKPVDVEEMTELAELLDRTASRWDRPLRLALGPAIRSPRKRDAVQGEWVPPQTPNGGPGWLLVSLSSVEPGDRARVVAHELWHAWMASPQWQPGEAAAVLDYGDRVRAAIRAKPSLGAGRSWLRPEEAEAVAYAVVVTGGAWPARIAPAGAALAALHRIAGT